MFMANMLLNKVYENIEERRLAGKDMSETKAIVDKILQVNQIDPRTEAKNNLHGDGEQQNHMVNSIQPRELKVY